MGAGATAWGRRVVWIHFRPLPVNKRDLLLLRGDELHPSDLDDMLVQRRLELFTDELPVIIDPFLLLGLSL